MDPPRSVYYEVADIRTLVDDFRKVRISNIYLEISAATFSTQFYPLEL